VLDGEGNPRIRLGLVGRGGQLELDAREGQTTLILGTDDELRSGLFVLRAGGGRLVPLSLDDMPPLAPENRGSKQPAKGNPPTGEKGPQPRAS